MAIHPACVMREGSWKDFREDVKKVNPELFNIIEKISPDDKYRLIKVTYLYGEKITDLGTVCVPDMRGKLARLDDPQVSSKLKDQLGYCATPLIVQLTNASEVFVEAKERTMPLNIFSPGDVYGLFETADLLSGSHMKPCWSVTSGIRSVFFVAKISDAIGHKVLRDNYGVPSQPPRRLVDQWETLKIIGKRANLEKPWVSEILIFTKDWFEKKYNDPSWLYFHYHIMLKSWLQSANTRAKLEYESLMWETYADFICKMNLKPNPYIMDTIKHLLLVANGTALAFAPLNQNKIFLPVDVIEKAYVEDYGLKYAPIILGPTILNQHNTGSCIYYSLSYPTLLEGTPAIRYPTSIISELQKIKTSIVSLSPVLEAVKASSFYEIIKHAEFRYFHDEADKFGEILPIGDIVKYDVTIDGILTRFHDREFPAHSQFFRGSIQISRIPKIEEK